MRGKFITLEGIDGAGKSSHVTWIADALRAAQGDIVVTREPGGTPLGERLRELLLKEPMDLKTETLLIFAARQAHLAEVILPALGSGKWVLSDRFTDATFAYQGGGRGVPVAAIETLEAWVQTGMQPDVTLFFDVPVAVGRSRLEADRADRDRFEREADTFFERVRAAYLERARRYPQRFHIIDGTRTIDEVRDSLRTLLVDLFADS